MRKRIVIRPEEGVFVGGALLGRQYINYDLTLRSGTIIYPCVTIGRGFSTGHNVLIRDNVIIGANVKIGSFTVLEGKNQIGDNVNIQSQCNITRGTIIKDGVFIGPGVVTLNDKYPESKPLNPPILHEGCIIGGGVVILPGIEIGANATIGAGSVVTRDVPPESLAFGVPCRVLPDPEQVLGVVVVNDCKWREKIKNVPVGHTCTYKPEEGGERSVPFDCDCEYKEPPKRTFRSVEEIERVLFPKDHERKRQLRRDDKCPECERPVPKRWKPVDKTPEE